MGTIREYTRSDGSKTYHAEVRLIGNPDQRASFRTRSLAKKWIQDTESAMRDGRHFKTAEAKRHTVGELIDRFINQWLPKNPKSQSKQTALLMWWKNRIGHLILADLSSSIIAEARDVLLSGTTIRKNLRSPSTVNRYLAAFSKVLSVGVKEWGWIDDSPMRKISKPSEAPGRDRYLTVDEKNRLLQACKASKNPYLYILVSLSIFTAMRFSELINLMWEDIDFDQRTIILRLTKNGDKRVLPLTDTVKSILMDCPTFSQNAVGLIFRSERKNNQTGVVNIRRSFEKALESAGIKSFRWHDLRHTAASYLAMNGATQGELMAVLGHRSPQMTRRYSHYSQKHLTDLLSRANDKFHEKNIMEKQ